MAISGRNGALSISIRTAFGGLALMLVVLAPQGPRAAGQDEAPRPGTFAPTWESLDRRPVPEWFRDAKFGVFIHWGVYSVPAWGARGSYAEWYLAGLNRAGSKTRAFHDRVYGPDFRYEDFAPRFRAELFDPDAWAELFEASGARYVILTSKHHDGFCLWPCTLRTGWNAVDTGPRRDLVGDLMTAVRGRGLRMGLYFSFMEWTHPLYPDHLDRYVEEYLLPQAKELVTRYRPDILWGDGEWDHGAEAWRTPELLAWLFNEGPNRDDVAVNDRWGGGTRYHHGGYYTSEYGAGLRDAKRHWEETRGMGASFGYNRNERLEDYASTDDLIRLLVDVVSRGGNLLLNVGPTADGRIPVIMEERLREIGAWLAVNGEGIYGTRRAERSGEYEPRICGRVDPVIDFVWPGAPIEDVSPNGFQADWTGYVQAERDGIHTFHTVSDDGVRLFVDGKKLIERWDVHGPTEDHGEIALEAGKMVPIRIEYFEQDGGATLRLLWTPPGSEKTVVPTRCLFSGIHRTAMPRPREGDGLLGDYRCVGPCRVAYTARGDDRYAFVMEWPKDELALDLPAPATQTELTRRDREGDLPAPADTLKVTLLGREGELPWRHEGERLRVDLRGIEKDGLPGGVYGFKLSYR